MCACVSDGGGGGVSEDRRLLRDGSRPKECDSDVQLETDYPLRLLREERGSCRYQSDQRATIESGQEFAEND
jgi:hypothetical protein